MRKLSFLICPLREEKFFSQRAFSIYTDIRKLQDKEKWVLDGQLLGMVDIVELLSTIGLSITQHKT